MQNPSLINDEEKMKLRLARTYTERFYMLMKLIRINHMLKNAKIVHTDKPAK